MQDEKWDENDDGPDGQWEASENDDGPDGQWGAAENDDWPKDEQWEAAENANQDEQWEAAENDDVPEQDEQWEASAEAHEGLRSADDQDPSAKELRRSTTLMKSGRRLLVITLLQRPIIQRIG